MRLSITHTLDYDCESRPHWAVQRLRLRPASQAGQQVVRWNLAIGPCASWLAYRDAFGNDVDFVTRARDLQRFQIVAEGEIHSEDRAGMVSREEDNVTLWTFLRKTALTQAGENVDVLVSTLPKARSTLDKLHALMGEIHESVDYLPGATDLRYDAESVLRSGKGDARGHAHAFIAAARAASVPARYVSGYHFVPMTETHSVCHSWAEAYVDNLGWVGFDTTRNRCPDACNVSLAIGFDDSDTAPALSLCTGETAGSIVTTIRIAEV
jgi:transglutaminase-like putative cysteine protease